MGDVIKVSECPWLTLKFQLGDGSILEFDPFDIMQRYSILSDDAAKHDAEIAEARAAVDGADNPSEKAAAEDRLKTALAADIDLADSLRKLFGMTTKADVAAAPDGAKPYLAKPAEVMFILTRWFEV